MIDGLNNHNRIVASSPDATAGLVSSSDVMSSPSFSAVTGTVASKDPHAVNGEEASQLKKSLQDLQVIAESREKNINEVSNFMHAQQIILSFDCLL